VEDDVIEGYVSLEKAREEYGVIINPKTLTLDEEATRKLRDTLRKAI
jgi:N-methylhydantoinase B